MTDRYRHQDFEQKWESIWQNSQLYTTKDNDPDPKFYILDMFPYPSGSGLHVGHPKGYIATDIVARYQRMNGYNVLHPMGWDAFGLPAENYALKNQVHPEVATKENIATFKDQLSLLGLSYDWSREINTTDPNYYRWTQWIFLQLYSSFYDRQQGKARPIDQLTIPEGLSLEQQRQYIDDHRLAYQSNEPINWCPSCQTGLAKEDLDGHCCERCGSPVELKPLRQWVLRITEYADRLINDLELLPDWEDSIKEMQSTWIGRSQGAEAIFKIQSEQQELLGNLKVFTTRPDTLFGCSYVAICPEHSIFEKISQKISNWSTVSQYIKEALNKNDLDRTDLNKDKTGIRLEGCQAINPVNGQAVPIFVADYVLGGYGSGAIMAVPAHDQRDYLFAQKYNLPITPVISSEPDQQLPYLGSGSMINSQFLNGLNNDQAAKKIVDWLIEQGIGQTQTNYRLQDWTFSRQRYWGEPIPIIHCQNCGSVPVPLEQLPVTLPLVDNYQPSGDGQSPLVNIKEWMETICPFCQGPAQREANTMPQWAGSSWYYLRYIDPDNNQALVDQKLEQQWSPVDLYVGGAEHATRHLIYARFWHKFLYDRGLVHQPEPFLKLRQVGLIMGADNRKMSKRWGNVVNPNQVVAEYGADALRLYEMFMGPFDQSVAWSPQGLQGTRKFLDRVWSLRYRIDHDTIDSRTIKSLLARTTMKVSQDIIDFRFNTAVSALMILVNKLFEQESISQDTYNQLLVILSPFAPYITQELWVIIGNQGFLLEQKWPAVDLEDCHEEMKTIIVQFSGKTRGTIGLPTGSTEKQVIEAVLATPSLAKYYLEIDQFKKIIFLSDRLINFVI